MWCGESLTDWARPAAELEQKAVDAKKAVGVAEDLAEVAEDVASQALKQRLEAANLNDRTWQVRLQTLPRFLAAAEIVRIGSPGGVSGNGRDAGGAGR